MLVRYTQDSSGKKAAKALIYTEKEHGIKPQKVDNEAIRVVAGLRNAGYEAYIVGGAVRDLLIGKTPKDFDIATSAEPARIRKIFRNSRLIGKRFRLVHIFFGQKIYEVSTFRSLDEGSVGNTFGTIDEDVHRRDFTLNALYYDPLKNVIVDYVGGVQDIRAKQLRPIIPLSHIFVEDPVRMIRAVKYAAITGAALPLLLRCRIHYDAPLIEYVSASRLTEEITKILMSGYAAPVFKQLLHYRLFLYLQPSAFAFIEDTADFEEQYFASMEELDSLIAEHKMQRQGQALVYFIRDFLQLITDWHGEPRAVYKTVYAECRHFVLPMNPQRIELEYAVKYCLRKGGLDIRLTGTSKAKELPVRRSRGTARQNGTGKQSPRYSGKKGSKPAVEKTFSEIN